MKNRWKILVSIMLILFLFIINLASAGTLNVQQKWQEQRNWCWAATSQTILEYYGTNVTQTQLANYAVGGRNEGLNLCFSILPYSYMDGLLYWFGSILSTCYDSYFYKWAVQYEIDSGRPLPIKINWWGGGAHSVVIYGIVGDYVYIRDPWPEHGSLIKTYNSVVIGSEHIWSQTLKLDSTPRCVSVSAFVTRFYQQCLGRQPEQAGLNGWVNALINSTLSGSDVAYGFIFSQEFINRNTSNETFVTILYRAFFGREPDTAGYNGWVNYLYSGASRQNTLNGFIYSQEFENLCANYGIAPYTS